MRELAVFFEFTRAEIYVAIDGIGISLVNKHRNYIYYSVDILGCLGVNGCRLDPESLCVLEVFRDEAFGDFFLRRPLSVGAVYYLVVDIGKVLNKGNVISAVSEIAAKHIKDNKATCVSDMEIIVYRRTAGIHTNFARLNRHKLFFFSCECVVDLHCIILLKSINEVWQAVKYLPSFFRCIQAAL